MAKWQRVRSGCRQVVLVGILLLTLQAGATPAGAADIHPQVAAAARAGTLTSVLVVLKRQADLSGAGRLATKAQKGAFVFQALQAMADGSQPRVLARIRALGLQAQPFWIENAIAVKAPSGRFISFGRVRALAGIADVAHLQPTDVGLVQPVAIRPAVAGVGPEPNIEAIGAPAVWRGGHTGEGIVVGSIDTGVDAQHPDLEKKYRGYTGAGSPANNDYNWFDPVTRSASPIDGNGHGTHTVGTMVGSGRVQEGVAPGAQWIACRALNDQGAGTIDFVLKCLQFMLAPTNRSGQNADPGRAPDVVNNSYGSGVVTTMNPALDSLYAAGIMMIAANGNTGRCGPVGSPAGYGKVVGVGATKQNGNLPPAAGSDAIASFSTRGPGQSGVIKPDLVAPGVAIVSAFLNDGYRALDGTSMAAPHVAGAVALLWSARPDLRGDIPATYNALAKTAERLTSTACPPNGAVENNTYGWGFIRVDKAVTAAGKSP